MALCRCDFRLRPEDQIEPAKELTNFDCRATGTTPEFKVNLWRPVFGWVLVRVRLSDDFRQEPLLRLHFDAESQSESGTTLQLVPAGYGAYEAIGFLASPVKHVRFTVANGEGGFTIGEFRLYNVPRAFVRRIGIRTLSAYHAAFRGVSPGEVRRNLLMQSRMNGRSLDTLLSDYIGSVIKPDDRITYETWIHRVEGAQIAHHLELSGKLDPGSYQPRISILLPVQDAAEAHLRTCLDSVLEQIYSCWDLCIVVDNCSAQAVRRLVEQYQEKDQRVRAAVHAFDAGPGGASAVALEMAVGEYVTVLKAGDSLAPDALLGVVEALQRQPRPRILYSDEDRIDVEGRRHSPHFKCGWNPDLLYSQNYICHLCVYETGLVRSVGGLRRDFEGSEEFDLLLRASGQVGDGDIVHLPMVLYHLRDYVGTRNEEQQADTRCWDRGRQALQSYLDSRGNRVRVERGPVPWTYRSRWPIPDSPPLVSVIVPTRDNFRLLGACVSSVLEKTRYPRFEILIIDNDSRDSETLEYLNQIADRESVRVLGFPGSFNYSAINNFAVAGAKGSLLCLLNDDIEVIEPDWLTEMVSHACRPEIGCVGAKLVYPAGTIQHGGVICGIGGIAGHSHRHFSGEENGYLSRLMVVQNLSAVTAACLVARRDVWEKAGGMNSIDLPVAYNDVDFCLRVRRQGLRILWTPYALMKHQESASRGAEACRNDRDRAAKEKTYMRETWGDYLGSDPYYSPHLTLEREDFSIRIAR